MGQVQAEGAGAWLRVPTSSQDLLGDIHTQRMNPSTCLDLSAVLLLGQGWPSPLQGTVLEDLVLLTGDCSDGLGFLFYFASSNTTLFMGWIFHLPDSS